VTSPALLAAILGGAELVVSMRLHGGILAATAGTPAVIIDYDPKTRAFAAQTGQTRWTVTVDDLESATAGVANLVEAIMETAATLPARRAALARAVAPLRSEAGRTARMAVQLASQSASRKRDVHSDGSAGRAPLRGRLSWLRRRRDGG
jgi:polysaccharide pyruvyl transferase WcaK-like protein